MKESRFKAIMYVNLAFLILAIIGNVYGYNITGDVQFEFNVIAVLLSLVYLLYAYKKIGATYFRWFMVFLALKESHAVFNMVITEDAPIYAVLIIAIMMIFYLALALVKDLGKTNSYILSITIMALSVLTFVSGLFFEPVTITEGSLYGLALAVFNLTRTLMSIITFIMIYAKYQDKYARGTK